LKVPGFLKFTLADGRKIYATTKGRFELFDADALDSANVRNNIERGAYTPDLSLCFTMASGERPDAVRIKEAKLEPASSPVDKTAFILGGKKAVADSRSTKVPSTSVA